MTETVTQTEAQAAQISAWIERWAENPPPNLIEALAAQGLDAEALESYARSGISTEQAETLRRVLIEAARDGTPAEAELLRRLTPILDPRERAWDRVIRAKNSGEILAATVTEATKGGLVVDLGIRGFIPASQIGLSVPRHLNQYVGRTLRFRVIEVDRRRQTVILSNRVVEEEQRAQRRRAAIERLEEGQVRTGTVRRITDIGAFVDVGGVDGLLHVSEISWNRVEHPSEALKVGQKIQVKVLRVDPEAGRVSLSMRRLLPDPWEEARRKYLPGMTLKVRVTRLVPQGAVVQVDEQLEGFLPISEMAHRRIASPEEVVQEGQELDALLTEFNPRERRLVFSLKKLEQKRERQAVESFQRRARAAGAAERTTLGDLFGHLFPEYQQRRAAEMAQAARPEPEAPHADEATPSPETVVAEDESGAPVAVVASEEASAGVPEEAAPEAPGAPRQPEAEIPAAETLAAEAVVGSRLVEESAETPTEERPTGTVTQVLATPEESPGEEPSAPAAEAPPAEEAAEAR